jgi:bifunctional pyridoxal-dependent enzyme with beta-cystathionase and maltose regulon repressor activities
LHGSIGPRGYTCDKYTLRITVKSLDRIVQAIDCVLCIWTVRIPVVVERALRTDCQKWKLIAAPPNVLPHIIADLEQAIAPLFAVTMQE